MDSQAEIVGEGFTDQTLALLRERPEVANVELHNSHLTIGLRGESKIGPLVSLIVRSGGEVEEIRRGKASLEDVFLSTDGGRKHMSDILTMLWKDRRTFSFRVGGGR